MSQKTPAVTVTAQPAITAGAYSADDALGDRLEFEYSTKYAKGTGTIISAQIIDDAGQDSAIDLLLFSEAFTVTADNAPIAISEADMENCVGVLEFPAADYDDTGVGSVVTILNKQLSFKLTESASAKNETENTGKKLYGQLVARGTPTYVATDDLTIKLQIQQD